MNTRGGIDIILKQFVDDEYQNRFDLVDILTDYLSISDLNLIVSELKISE